MPRLLVFAVLVLLPPGAAAAQARRGPIEAREHWLLVQPSLTLPALSPDLLAPGRSTLGLQLDWGNDLGWKADVPGEDPGRRSFLVDGEHRSLALEWRRGLAPRLELGARASLEWRGGGSLDGLIDWFHGFTRKLGLPDNGRRRFVRDRLRVLGRGARGEALDWSGAHGSGLGDLELQARWALRRGARSGTGWPLTLAARAALPTAIGALDSGGLAGGLQLATAQPLGAGFDVYLGAGATVHARRHVEGLAHARLRPQGYAALEWRAARRLSLLLQLDLAGRAIEDVDDYPALQSYLRLGGKLDLGERLRLEAGFAENIKNQQSTTDFAVFLGLTRR